MQPSKRGFTIGGIIFLLLVLGLLANLPEAESAQGAGAPAAILDSSGVDGLELVGQYGGIVWAIAVQGQYAYVGIGPRLVVFDIRPPANPTPVGRSPILPRLVYRVAVAGSYAYVTDEEDLYVIDISNPAHPTLVGTAITPNYARGVAVKDDYVYVGDGYDLRVYDVSDPANPVEAGSLTFSPADIARSIAISGEYAYAAGWANGLHAIHIADPTNPAEVGGLDTAGMERDIAASGGYVYIAADGLQVVNVSDPANPAQTGAYEIPESTGRSVAVSGNYAYVGGYNPAGCSLSVVNVSNPSNPTGVGYLDTPDTPVGLAVSGNYVFVADNLDLLVVNVSDPAHPAAAAAFQKTPLAYGVAAAGDYAYVADHDFGLRVLDAADPAGLEEIGFFDAPGNALDVVVSGNYAYLAGHNGGMRVIDVSSPASPTQVGVYDPVNAEAFRLALAGDYIYIADYDYQSLRILDVSNPASPNPVGVYAAPYPVKAVAASNTLFNGRRYAYIAEYQEKAMGSDSTLRVIDVTDPAHPSSAGVLQNVTGSAFDLAVVEGSGVRYVYLADGSLRIIDVSDPANPSETLNIPAAAGSSYRGVAVSGDRAYLAYDAGGAAVYDITDLANPTQLGVIDTASQAIDVAVYDEQVYIADWTGGVVVLGTPGLTVSPKTINWLAELGGDDPTPLSAWVESSGSPLTWTATISPTVGWLEAAPLSGETPAEIVLTTHTGGLGEGQYQAQIILEESEEVSAKKAVISIKLIVAEFYYSYLPLVMR